MRLLREKTYRKLIISLNSLEEDKSNLISDYLNILHENLKLKGKIEWLQDYGKKRDQEILVVREERRKVKNELDEKRKEITDLSNKKKR